MGTIRQIPPWWAACFLPVGILACLLAACLLGVLLELL